MKTIVRARQILQIEIEQLQKVRRKLGPGFGRAVALILACLKQGGKVVVTGVGKNFLIGQKVSATLSSMGSTSVVLHPSQALHGDVGVLKKNDVLLALSFSGESGELLTLLPVVKRQGVKVVAMTGDAGSTLARYSDEVIHIAVTREACPFNMAPTASTTAAMALGDALAIVLLEAQGFKKEDFAKLHPGGTIGHTLLLRVFDIMRKGERLAMVSDKARVKDAILAMTSARAGSVGIVDGKKKLLGIFSDGDLRRLIGQRRNFNNLLIKEVMIRNPVTVQSGDLAVDVLKIYEEHNFDDLLVVDDKKRLVGIIDIQDLPKFKIL